MQPKKQLNKEGRTVWRLDRSTSSVKFSVKKLLFITVTGRLADLEGSIVLNQAELSASSVQATIAADSVETGNERRDAHLRSPSFLDIENYPVIEFHSTEVGRGTDRDMFVVKGALRIKNTSKDVALTVTEVDRSKAPDGTEVVYYVAEAEIDRYAFGINTWPGVIGKKLKVTIDIQANREN
jgi:polyisoprenoid-binding protein YceI